nr:unnamed protein product [Leishmania braziliensis]
MSFKDCFHEVRKAATEHLEGYHRSDADKGLQHIPREEALVSISLVAIRLLEQELQKRGADDDAAQHELHAHLKKCRKALKSLSAHSVATAGEEGASDRKRHRSEGIAEVPTSSSLTRGTAAADQPGTTKSIDLGQYASSGAFDQNEQKRMKFARLMGGVKGTTQGTGGAGAHSRHNTFAVSSAEMKRMNASLESQFESAMHHKGKKGLGA